LLLEYLMTMSSHNNLSHSWSMNNVSSFTSIEARDVVSILWVYLSMIVSLIHCFNFILLFHLYGPRVYVEINLLSLKKKSLQAHTKSDLISNSKLGVTSNSWNSPSKFRTKLPPNSNLMTKNLPSGTVSLLCLKSQTMLGLLRCAAHRKLI
jgi:hypothetical protein